METDDVEHDEPVSDEIEVVELMPEEEAELEIVASDADSEDEELEESSAPPRRVPARDDATTTFSAHQQPVFCVRAVRKDQQLLCLSGGQDDRVRLWNGSTAQQLFECAGT